MTVTVAVAKAWPFAVERGADREIVAGSDPVWPWAQFGVHVFCWTFVVPVADVADQLDQWMSAAEIEPSPQARRIREGS